MASSRDVGGAAPRLAGSGLGQSRALSRPDKVIGHCEVASWNVVARDGLPIALIDRETAGPVDPLAELAQLLGDRLGPPRRPPVHLRVDDRRFRIANRQGHQ
jgi:hypothetical protein